MLGIYCGSRDDEARKTQRVQIDIETVVAKIRQRVRGFPFIPPHIFLTQINSILHDTMLIPQERIRKRILRGPTRIGYLRRTVERRVRVYADRFKFKLSGVDDT